MKIGLAFLLILVFFPSFAQNTLLWEISGNGLKSPSYLYGTMHILCKDDLPNQDSIPALLARCNRLVFEMDDAKVGVFKQLRMLRMKGDTSLSDLFTEEEYLEVAAFFRDSLNTSINLLKRTKPALSGTLLLVRNMPCSPKEVTGVEKELRKMADSLDIRIDELETFKYQAALFDSISYSEQAKELLESVRNYAKVKEEFSELTRLYKLQALDSIALFTSNNSSFSAEMDAKFLTNRNKNWAEKMPAMMTKYPVFFAVGAAHLPGESGLIALLRAAGYEVKPLIF